MICPMVPFPVTLSDPWPRFQGHGVIFMPIDARMAPQRIVCAADAPSVGDS